MIDRHPDREILERFLDGDLADDASCALQRHLFLCRTCEERLVDLLPAPPPPSSPDVRDEYRDLIRRLLESQRTRISDRRAALVADRAAAAELWRDLEPHDREGRRALIRNHPRFQTWGFFELLVELSRQAVLEDPRTAEDLLRLVIDVVGQLDPDEHGPGSLEAAEARAWAWLGNALRVQEDFAGAETAFQTAELYLAQSWLDPLDEALLLELKAPLRRAQRRFDEALEMLDGAIAIYREINEPNLQGRALMVRGVTLQYQGDLEGAADCFRTSMTLLEEPRLVALNQYNLVFCLQDAGRSLEAAALIPETRRRLQKVGKRIDLLRLRWTEGKIAASTGRQAEAERALLEVRAARLKDAHAFDAALVSLDLAALYLRQRRLEETKRLAAEILPVFQSREIYREALAALIVFQRAAEMEQLTLGLVEEVAAYLERARDDPHLRFRDADAEAS
jgi:tetratricopeptide (TPR) repeat protein